MLLVTGDWETQKHGLMVSNFETLAELRLPTLLI